MLMLVLSQVPKSGTSAPGFALDQAETETLNLAGVADKLEGVGVVSFQWAAQGNLHTRR